MKLILLSAFGLSIIGEGCQSKENKIALSDLKPNFSYLLNQKDCTLALDSFYFIRTDSMNEKQASLSRMIANAYSVTPVGYRAFYKVTVSKKEKIVVSDTIPYAISLKMKVSDWDRNLEKIIDSLAMGKPFLPRGIHP